MGVGQHIEGMSQAPLAGRDVQGLGFAAPARLGVENVHAFAAGADDVRDEARAVTANVLEH